MLVTPAKQPFSSPDWLYEVKWDGMRALANIGDGHLRLTSRRGRCVTAQYPELQSVCEAVDATKAVIDGEIIVADAEGHSDFDRLMNRMRVESWQRVEWERRQAPVTFVAFDLLFLEGRDLRQQPLFERKSLLRQLLTPGGHVAYSDHVEEDGEAFYQAVCDRGIEGVVAKRKDAPYISSGRRTRLWLKWKRPGWNREWNGRH